MAVAVVPEVAPAVEAAAGAVVVVLPRGAAGLVEGVEAAWPNRPPEGAAACAVEVAGAAVVAAVPGVLDAVVLPIPENKPPEGAAAGVLEGAALDVAPPIAGKRDFWGVAVEVAGAPRAELGAELVVEGAPPRLNAGFGADAPAAEVALLPNREGVDCAGVDCWVPCAGAAAPNKEGLGVLSAGAGVVDEAGLS